MGWDSLILSQSLGLKNVIETYEILAHFLCLLEKKKYPNLFLKGKLQKWVNFWKKNLKTVNNS